jgi:hypothetical protein
VYAFLVLDGVSQGMYLMNIPGVEEQVESA